MSSAFFRISFVLVSLIQLKLAIACSCGPPPTFGKAVADAKNSNSPYYLATVLSQNIPSDINGQVLITVRVKTGCKTTRIQLVTTVNNGGLCGIRLTVVKEYAMPLKRNGDASSEGLCTVRRDADRLTAAQRQIVSHCSTLPPGGLYTCKWVCKYIRNKRCSSHCRQCCRNGRCEDTGHCHSICKKHRGTRPNCGETPPAQQPICSMECRKRPQLIPAIYPPPALPPPSWNRCKCCCLNGSCTRSRCEANCYRESNCGYNYR